MTIEQIYCDLSDDLRFQLYEINMDWDFVAARLPIENYDGYGIVVWCYSEGDVKCWLVSIRENFSDDDWGNEIFEELTFSDAWEELEKTVTELLRKFYNTRRQVNMEDMSIQLTLTVEEIQQLAKATGYEIEDKEDLTQAIRMAIEKYVETYMED